MRDWFKEVERLQNLSIAQQRVINDLTTAGKGMLDKFNGGLTVNDETNRPCRRMIRAIAEADNKFTISQEGWPYGIKCGDGEHEGKS